MRKIEQEMLDAIAHHRNWKKSNTEVRIHGIWANVYLFGNHIAAINSESGEIYLNHHGYFTNTTRSRFQALGADVKIRANSRQEKYYLVDGENTWYVGLCKLNKCGTFQYYLSEWELPKQLSAEEIRAQEIEKMKNCAAAQNKRRYRATLRQSKMWSRMLFT